MEIKEIPVQEISQIVKRLCIEANTVLGEDMMEALRKGYETEKSPIGKNIFLQLLENAKIAKEEGIALCQDTGLAVVFVELGQDVHVVGGDLTESINEGVRQGYRDGYLRKASLDPLIRKNFGDNTPAIIHTEIVPGDRLRLIVAWPLVRPVPPPATGWTLTPRN